MVFKEQPLLFYALTPTVLTVSRLWMLEAVSSGQSTTQSLLCP